MATILKQSSKNKAPTERKKLRQKLYHIKEYRTARNIYLETHIWCNRCLQDGEYKPGTELHHIKSPFDSGLSEYERYSRLMDEGNWELLCKDCHIKHHAEEVAENKLKKEEWKRRNGIYR